MAWNFIQAALLCIALGMGGWVVKSVKEHGEMLASLKRDLQDTNREVVNAGRGRWTTAAQIQYNAELGAMNQALRTPDVRRIIKENE